MRPSKAPAVKVDWCKHAKPDGKRAFWHKLRRKVKAILKRGEQP